MLASEAFIRRTGKKFLYNINLIENIPSVMKYGILCFDDAKKLPHTSIAMTEVQSRRSRILVPNGSHLHRYANLYFDYHNPMMYRRKDQAGKMCILAVDCAVLDIDGCVITDRNAAADIAKFLEPLQGLDEIDFERVYARYWNHPDDEYEMRDHRAVKCAEILVPRVVPPPYLLDACVVDSEARSRLLETGFDRPIYVNAEHFFC